MSDFVGRDVLPDLWDEILQQHWLFLETEDRIPRLEQRKKLEDCLRKFLCIVPHDRKFFLPETGQVLRKTVFELDEFTAQKAAVGFDAISQYANNLFSRPWRKEYRVLKTYSGYFQHEVQANLLDVNKMFEAMGYRHISDEVFMLEGPICPDQVTNVSRDAMAACVECQIMKNIYAGLVAMGLSCTWQEIYKYRERHVGGTSQAIKEIGYAIQERILRKEKPISTTPENTYGNLPPPPLPPQMKQLTPTQAINQCENCALYHQQYQQLAKSNYMQPPAACALHHINNNPNLSCAMHAHMPLEGGGTQLSQMSHSRSLDHYNEPHATLPHRHSFDHQQEGCTAHQYHQQQQQQHHQQQQQLRQQQFIAHPQLYESPYDCLDGVSIGSSASYAAVTGSVGYPNAYTHPYNAPGNRYPLPYNISNQLNTHYATPAVSCNSSKGADSYLNVENNAYATVAKPAYSCNYHAQQLQQHQQQPQQPQQQQQQHHHQQAMTLQGVAANTPASASAAMQYRQCSFPPDQLIDFDDRAPLTKHDYHAQMHTTAPMDYERRPSIRANMNVAYGQAKDNICAHEIMPQLTGVSNDMYVYARPVPKSSRTIDKYIRNMEPSQQDYVDNNRKKHKELKEKLAQQQRAATSGNRRKTAAAAATTTTATTPTAKSERDTSDLTSDAASLDDFVTIGHGKHLLPPTPTFISRNQDGVGSFESWNYVFQNLERSGYSKDLGDREDLLVQSLDLDSLTLANGADKHRTAVHHSDSKSGRLVNSSSNSNQQQSQKEKSRTLEKTTTASGAKRRETNKSTVTTTTTTTPTAAAVAASTATQATPLVASIVTASGKKVKSALKVRSATSAPIAVPTATASSSTTTAVVVGNTTNSDNRNSVGAAGGGIGAGVASHTGAISKQRPPVSTQLIVTSPNEWSCRFCTFLNPDTKRICEMCCRSKDFNPEASSSVSHASSTCV